MKVLRLNAYFEPEITAASHLMNDIYEGLAVEHIKCKIITPEPTRGISKEVRKAYKKKRKEKLFKNYLEVERFPMIKEESNPIQRAIRYMLCSAFHYYKGIHEKNVDIIFSGSTPPTNGVISALVAKKLSKKYKKKVPFVYELQDIFPDSMVNAKLINKESLLWKIGRKLEDYTYAHTDKIIVPTKTMMDNLLDKGVNAEKIEVISNWIDVNTVKYIEPENNFLYKKLNLTTNEFVVIYAGNIGEAQGADIILKVANKLKEYSEIRFIIFGGGSNFEDFKKESLSYNNVVVRKLLPLEYVSNVYSIGNSALITCKKGTGVAGMPSKTWSIMACNVPIIASFDEESELAKTLEKSESGVCVEAENEEKLSNAIKASYFKWKKDKISLNSKGREYVESNASREKCVGRYIDILKNYNSI